jgi:hypothetical protein
VPEWKRIIVGDAFKLRSSDPRYYANIFLFWPTLLFTWALAASLWKWPLTDIHWHSVIILVALFGTCFLLFTERAVVAISLLAYTAYLAWRAFVFGHLGPRDAFELIVVCFSVGLALYLLNRVRIRRSAAKDWPDELDFLALCAGVGGIIFAFIVLFALRRWIDL